jgi:hypothetical protein
MLGAGNKVEKLRKSKIYWTCISLACAADRANQIEYEFA